MANKASVLMLTENFWPLSTASAQRSFAYASTLASHSSKTLVIAKSPSSFETNKIIAIGYNHKKEIPIFDPVLLFLYLIKSALVIRKCSTNLILSSVPKMNNAIAGFLLSKLFRVPHIIDVRDYWEASLLSYPVSRIIPKRLVLLLMKMVSLIYRTAASVITVNETLRKMLNNRGIPLQRIFIIPNGIDTSLFKPTEDEKHSKKLRKKYLLPTSRTIFTYAGSLAPHYKIDAVLKGMSRLDRISDFMFLIIGRPTLLMTNRGIRQIVDKLGLKENVRVMDPLPVSQTAEVLKCSDVGVIPLESKEIWRCMTTVKLFAYLASGLPILASGPKDGELEGFIERHNVGIFVGTPTPQNFAEGVREILRKKSDIAAMGLRARRIMKESYDRYVLCREIVPLVCNVINKHYATARIRNRPLHGNRVNSMSGRFHP